MPADPTYRRTGSSGPQLKSKKAGRATQAAYQGLSLVHGSFGCCFLHPCVPLNLLENQLIDCCGVGVGNDRDLLCSPG